MKITNYILAAVLALLGLSCSHERNQSSRARVPLNGNIETKWSQVDAQKPGEAAQLRRLESVTWDSVKHELIWNVSKGEKKGESYQPQSKDVYEINMDRATMTVNGESRRFSADEAANVRTLMDFISRYALESTVWWENGEGEPVDGRNPPKPERQTPHQAPTPDRDGNTKARTIQIVATNTADSR